jgi:hypothetical protein
MAAPVVITAPEKSNNILLWLLGFTAAGGLAIYYFKNLPKKAGVHGIQNASQAQLQALAGKLHEAIDGLTVFSYIEVYQQALALSDGDFIRLYNIYNELYQEMDSETLTYAVSGELSWLNNAFELVKEEFLARCAALNLP